MKRREFIALLGASPAWPNAGYPQQPGKIFRIGFLGVGSAANWANRIEALHGGLRDLGYVDGKNIVIEFRWTEAIEQLPELATELVRMKVDLIFAISSESGEDHACASLRVERQGPCVSCQVGGRRRYRIRRTRNIDHTREHFWQFRLTMRSQAAAPRDQWFQKACGGM